MLAFDDGAQSESNTLLLTDWLANTPPEVLAKNFRVAQEVFGGIPLHNLWIFPGDEPGDLEADQVAAGVEWGGTEPVIFRMSQLKPAHENSGGSIRIADSADPLIARRPSPVAPVLSIKGSFDPARNALTWVGVTVF